MISDCRAVTSPLLTTLPFMSAARLTGVARKRLRVPRRISSSMVIPAHTLEPRALITTTPGTRQSRYEVVSKPPSSTTPLKGLPNGNSQITGWIRVISAYAGCRTNAVS
jgi:hypothetical protein